MTISSVITGCLNDIVPALTPIEKWKAARSFTSNYAADRGFILIGTIALIVLVVLFLAVSLRKEKQKQKSDDRLFIEYARKIGLSNRECKILFKAAQKAGLKQSESIFTMSTAFDRGTAKMLEEAQTDPRAVEESNQLRMELVFLREKLGYKQKTSSSDSSAQSAKLSSRQIPIGKKIHITRRKVLTAGNIEATVVKNSDNELGIRLAQAVRITFGESWCARYYFGSSVWEFDTAVIGYDGDMLVLSHSDNVRFINRRRFLRVPVKMSGFIATFPFEKLPVEVHRSEEEEQAQGDASEQPVTFIWGPPEFVPAVVTELAGPGLRVESSLDLKVGDRILIVFNLAQEQHPVSANEGNKMEKPKIVEATGEVRHIRPIQNGLSVAVELTGLSDPDIDELIRATNAALPRDGNANAADSGDAGEAVVEQTGVSGVRNV
jgi:preprotein translocase subunit YajC